MLKYKYNNEKNTQLSIHLESFFAAKEWKKKPEKDETKRKKMDKKRKQTQEAKSQRNRKRESESEEEEEEDEEKKSTRSLNGFFDPEISTLLESQV